VIQALLSVDRGRRTGALNDGGERRAQQMERRARREARELNLQQFRRPSPSASSSASGSGSLKHRARKPIRRPPRPSSRPMTRSRTY
jgi:hypothetical protein